jgi:hypothetical protein
MSKNKKDYEQLKRVLCLPFDTTITNAVIWTVFLTLEIGIAGMNILQAVSNTYVTLLGMNLIFILCALVVIPLHEHKHKGGKIVYPKDIVNKIYAFQREIASFKDIKS